MKFNRILSSALLVVMIFMTFVTVIPFTAEAAYSGSHSSSANLTAAQIQAEVEKSYTNQQIPYASAEEKLYAEMPYLNSVSMGDYILYVNKYTGSVYYKNKVTGQILTSNPYKYTNNKDVNREISSQLAITYSEITVGQDKTLYSTVEAAERAQISTDFIKNGIRVSYTLGDTTARYLLPGAMQASKFEEIVLVPILENIAELMQEYEEYEGEFDVFTNPIYNVEEDKNTDNAENLYQYGYLNLRIVRNYINAVTSRNNSVHDSDKSNPQYRQVSNLATDIMTIYGQGSNCYTLKNPAKYSEEDDNYKNMILEFYSNESSKIFESKEAIYVFTGKSNNSKLTASTIFRDVVSGYTFAHVHDDEEYCGYVDETDQKPVFRCALEYTFNDDGSLSVRMPVSSLSFDETVYNLSNISVLPYFGCASIEDDGYVFFPDGSGTVAEFSDFYDKDADFNVNSNVIVDIYGKDYCFSNITGAHREQISMPVYGMVGTETANSCGLPSVKNGFFAIIEEGMSLASLSFEMDITTKLANVCSLYKPYPSDIYDLSETLSVGGAGFYTIVAEDNFNGSYVTRYAMLTDKSVYAAKKSVMGAFYEASYVGMANYYRDYLNDMGVLSDLENVRDSLPLYLEVLGSMEIIDKFLSFPITKNIALTEFEHISTIYDELRNSKTVFNTLAKENKSQAVELAKEIATIRDKINRGEIEADEINDAEREIEEKVLLIEEHNKIARTYEDFAKDFKIDNINFRLTGFGNGGLYNTYPTKLRWSRACGGKSGFRDLLETAKAAIEKGENFGIYPDFDFAYISYTEMFDGVSKRANASKMIDNRYASKQVYDSVSREYVSYFTLVVNTETLDELYGKFADKYADYDISNISVATLGSDLNSNFDEDAPVIRDQSQHYVEAVLDRMTRQDGYDVMLDVGNSYTLEYASHILNMNIDSSHFRYSSYPVPFTGMVLHGSVNYTGNPINYSGNPDYDLLRAIESGASLYYILCYQNSSYMKEDPLLNDYYGIDYANWFQNIVTTYAELNSAIGSLQDYKIVDHKVVIGERIIEPDEEKANLVILMNEIIEMLDAKFLEAKDRALEALKESGAAYGTVIYLDVDVDSLMDAFEEILNEENVENYRIESDVTFGDLVNEVVAWHTRNNPQDPAASNVVEVQINAERFFGDISGKNTEDTLDDYVSAHSFITDSFATDEDYVYTDFTSDKDIVLVTYQNAEGKEVKFLINYNIYTVQVDLDDGKDAYTLPKYGYVKIG